jgi:hypothetical protein
MKWIVVFVLMLVTDVVWTVYIRRVGQGHALQSAVMATALLAMGGFVVVSYTENHWMLIPACLGSFVGTYFTVRWEKR